MKKHVYIFAAFLALLPMSLFSATKTVEARALEEEITSLSEDTDFIVTGELFDGMLYDIASTVKNSGFKIGLDLSATTGLTSIEDYEFTNGEGFYMSENTSLSSIILPDSVTEIGTSAFERCTELKSIVIPAGVKKIGLGAFRRCRKLKTLTFFSNKVKIDDDAFANCTSLTGIAIPDGSVETIGDFAFRDCAALTKITIPNSVTWIGRCAFSGCTNLRTINASEKMTRRVKESMTESLLKETKMIPVR